VATTGSPSTRPTRRFTVPMVARTSGESHRVSTPLELLFDLTFVAAVGQLRAALRRRHRPR
jgi:low temperature requirement protein LtrA